MISCINNLTPPITFSPFAVGPGIVCAFPAVEATLRCVHDTYKIVKYRPLEPRRSVNAINTELNKYIIPDLSNIVLDYLDREDLQTNDDMVALSREGRRRVAIREFKEDALTALFYGICAFNPFPSSAALGTSLFVGYATLTASPAFEDRRLVSTRVASAAVKISFIAAVWAVAAATAVFAIYAIAQLTWAIATTGAAVALGLFKAAKLVADAAIAVAYLAIKVFEVALKAIIYVANAIAGV